MRKLILVKHSMPTLNDKVPSNEWVLSEVGKKNCIKLSKMLEKYEANSIFSSNEPKALETAKLVAGILNKDVKIESGLHEHERTNEKLLTSELFKVKMKEFFIKQDELVFGKETAIEAQKRFYNAVNELISKNQDDNIIIVAHGTVITLFVSMFNKINLYEVWNSLELPSFIELSIPKFQINKVVTNMESLQLKDF